MMKSRKIGNALGSASSNDPNAGKPFGTTGEWDAKPKGRDPRNSEKSETCGRGRMRVSVERLVECCRRSNGIVSVVATLLGVDWHTADKYIKKCPEAMEIFSSSREAVCDVAESNLLRIVNNPNHPRHFEALTFLLSRLAKKRGYTEKIEQELSGIKAPPPLNIVIEK